MSHGLSRPLWLTGVLALLTALVAGCGAAPAAGPGPVEAAATTQAALDDAGMAAYALAGTSWNLDYFGAPEQPVPMLADSRASVTFLWDRYAGFDGCNFFIGTYEAGADGVLLVDMPARTIEFCEPDELEEQAAMFSSALLNVRGYTQEGEQLAVTTEGGGRILTFNAAPPMPMSGTMWDLKFWSLPEDEEWQPVIIGSATNIVFGAGGEASGLGGCNDYTAPYEGDLDAPTDLTAAAEYADLPTLTIGPISAQTAACSQPDGIMDQEQTFFTGLSAVAYYFKLGGTLLLLDADGNPLLIFAARG